MKQLFIVGCPRSGTTWLQIVLGSHPAIATVRETHLFDRYLSDLYGRYEAEAHKLGKDGLRVLLSPERFDVLGRGFADGVLAEIAATKPDSAVVLEKTASQIWTCGLMRRLYPEAVFVHVIRDPRAVVASMLAYASEAWANEPGLNAATAAEVWRDAVTLGRQELAETAIELRYEDLRAEPDQVLAPIWQRLAIEPMAYDPDRFSIDGIKSRRTDGPPREPGWENRENFFRRGTEDGWRTDLDAEQVATVEAICWPLMAALGYPPA